MNLKSFSVASAFLVLAIYLALLVGLIASLDPTRILKIISSERLVFSTILSLKAAILATFIAMVLAVPAGYALSRLEFRGKAIVDTLLEVPLIITPVAFGAMLLIFFNTRAGILLQTGLGSFVFEFSGIVLAQFLTTAGLTVRMVKGTFDGIPARFEAVACSLGATPLQAFTTTTLPMAARGIIAAACISFAKCLGEFGATAMIAGAMPMKSETLPISIFIRLGSADIEGMAILILILLAVGISVILILKFNLKQNYD